MPRTEVKAYQIQHHGNTRWRVLVPKALRGDGPAKRIFTTQKKATEFARELNAGRIGWSGRLLALSDEDQGRLVRAVEKTGSVANVELACEAWAKFRVSLRKRLDEAAAECVEAKRQANRSWQYVENLGVALGSFAAGREACQVSDVTGPEIESWLAGNGWSAETRITYARRLKTFFSWCQKRGYSAANPVEGIERPTASHAPVVVLPVYDARRLLSACRRVDPALLPYFAIGLFAGIRPDELKRLRRENIKDGWIEVEAAKAKTRRRRLVEIHPTLKAWLSLGGDIGWRNWRRRWRQVRAATCVGDYGPEQPVQWVSDIMRHTFCSYAFPINGARWTSEHAGHSESVLFRNYRELVPESAAREFWSIVP